MSDIERGQVVQSAAEIYDEFFVPALFIDWPKHVATAANIQPGHRVLDVACGTGVLTRFAAGLTGSVTGLDVNEGMLAVARSKSPQIEWKAGAAEDIPYADNQFDAVVSQFGLMFFNDQVKAVQQMMRVLKPGGHLAIAVWGELENAPGYHELAGLLLRLFGEEAANGIRAPFNLGNKQTLQALFANAGIQDTTIITQVEKARFPSIRDWMFTEIKGWVLADKLDDDQFEMLLKEAEVLLRPFLTSNNTVEFDVAAHIVTAVRQITTSNLR